MSTDLFKPTYTGCTNKTFRGIGGRGGEGRWRTGVKDTPACRPLSDSMAVLRLRPGKSRRNPALSAHHVIVDKFLLSVSSPEKMRGGPGWSLKLLPTTVFSGCDSATAALNYGRPSVCANLTMHLCEETNSP